MKDYGKVSVIMPAYNHSELTKKAIKSVIDQTYKNWELVVVDDCSSDDTGEAVASFSDPRIRYFRNESNQGCAYSRNRAIKESSGEWVATLDSDDMWANEKLEKQLKFMCDHRYTFTCTEYIEVNADDIPTGILVSAPKKITRYRHGQYGGYIGTLTVMYSQKKYGHIQIDERIKNGANDEAIYWKIYDQGATCFLLKDVLSYYHVHDDSCSHSSRLDNLKTQYRFFRILGNNKALSLFRALRNGVFYVLVKKPFYRKKVNPADYVVKY